MRTEYKIDKNETLLYSIRSLIGELNRLSEKYQFGEMDRNLLKLKLYKVINKLKGKV